MAELQDHIHEEIQKNHNKKRRSEDSQVEQSYKVHSHKEHTYTGHKHDGHDHNHGIGEFQSVSKKRLKLSLFITITFMFVEIIGGLIVNSISLVNDGGHMFTHAFSITIALIGLKIAERPPCHERTYGSYRAEILAAFINGLFLLLVVGFLIFEAVERIFNPVLIDSTSMLVVAILGLVVNITSVLILQDRHKDDLNIQGVFSHMIADTMASVGVIVAAIVIQFTSWTILDPLVSLVIAAVIIAWAVRILKESGRILLEIAPEGLTTDIISENLVQSFPQIEEVFHIHLWTITSNINVISFHLKLKSSDLSKSEQINLIEDIEEFLAEKYKIVESTIQVLNGNNSHACKMI